ncbi:integrase, catalytic region, zinc finger, CCHC-type containing protein [Tanacetum coccineum]
MDSIISPGQKNTLAEYMILSGDEMLHLCWTSDCHVSWEKSNGMILCKIETGSRVAKDLWQRVQLLMQCTSLTKQERECFAVPVFSPGDDPIACLNKAMSFLTAVASSRFPSINNQLRTSSNPRNQATIQEGRVTVQQVKGRQGKNYSSTTYKGNDTSSRGNTTSGQARVVKCYNCQGEGHIARQCTQPK